MLTLTAPIESSGRRAAALGRWCSITRTVQLPRSCRRRPAAHSPKPLPVSGMTVAWVADISAPHVGCTGAGLRLKTKEANG